MKNEITLYQDETLGLDIEGLASNLNLLCEYFQFKVGKAKFSLRGKIVTYPDSYNELGNALIVESKDSCFSILATNKKYYNNFFFMSHDNLCIASFYGWSYLTDLPMINGLLYFIVDKLALEYDSSYRHEETTGCIYDFLWDKTGIDQGMKMAKICDACQAREQKNNVYKSSSSAHRDLQRMLEALGRSSSSSIGVFKVLKDKSKEISMKKTSKKKSVKKNSISKVELSKSKPLEKVKEVQNALFISDLHIGRYEGEAEMYLGHLSTDLVKSLDIKQLDFVVVAGDIATTAGKDEYSIAAKFFNRLINDFTIDRNNIIIVPGNHDVNWEDSRKEYTFLYLDEIKGATNDEIFTFNEVGALVKDERFNGKRFEKYIEFYKEISGNELSTENLSCNLRVYSEQKLLFLSLNSSSQIDHLYKERAAVNTKELTNVLTKTIHDNYKEYIKIALWHHPLDNMTSKDFMEQLHLHEFDIVVSGHLHKASAEKRCPINSNGSRNIHLVELGTFGAPTAQQQRGIPLQYCLAAIDVSKREVTIKSRKKETVDGVWSPDARWREGGGDPKSQYTIKL